MTENTSLKIESKRYNVMKKEKEKFFRFWTENQYRLLLMYTGFQNKRSSQLHRVCWFLLHRENCLDRDGSTKMLLELMFQGPSLARALCKALVGALQILDL